jgi:hypothetical protein
MVILECPPTCGKTVDSKTVCCVITLSASSTHLGSTVSFLAGTGVWTHAVLYHLSHTLLHLVCFSGRVLCFCLGVPQTVILLLLPPEWLGLPHPSLPCLLIASFSLVLDLILCCFVHRGPRSNRLLYICMYVCVYLSPRPCSPGIEKALSFGLSKYTLWCHTKMKLPNESIS